MVRPRLLIIDEAINLSLLYKEELLEEGYDVDVANSIPEAKMFLEINTYNLMIVETRLKLKNDYKVLCAMLNNDFEGLPVIINTGTPMSEFDSNLCSFHAYIEKSSDLSLFKEIVNDTFKYYAL